MLPVCLDGHGLASGWVPAFPCGAVLDFELAEPVERNFLALGRSLANPCEHRIDNLARVSLGDRLFGGELFGKISVVHGIGLLVLKCGRSYGRSCRARHRASTADI